MYKMMEYNKEFVAVLSDLKFIASIKRGEIVYINDRVIKPRTIFSTPYRRYVLKGESGPDTVNFIQKTLYNTYNLINKYRQMKGSDKYIKHLVEHIVEVRRAIDELKVTYQKYTYIDACLDSIKIDVDGALEVFQSWKKDSPKEIPCESLIDS